MIYRRVVHLDSSPRWVIEKTTQLAYPWEIIPPGSRGQSVRAYCFRSGEEALGAFNSPPA